MRYLVLKAQKKKSKNDKNEKTFFFTSIFNGTFFNSFFYVKDGEKFKIAKISCSASFYGDDENKQNRYCIEFFKICLEKGLSNVDLLYDIDIILNTNSEEDFLEYLNLNNIVPFEKYHMTNSIDKEIVNKSSLKDDIVMNFLKDVNISQIKSVDYDSNNYSIVVNNKASFMHKNSTLYCTKDFFEWCDKHLCQNYNDKMSDNLRDFLCLNLLIGEKNISQEFNYVSATEKSIEIYNIKVTVSCENYKLIYKISDNSYYNYTFGKEIVCVKKLKNSDHKISPFTMFNINSKTVLNPKGIYFFENAVDIEDFFFKNYSFFEKSGLIGFISGMKKALNLLPLLILYLCLIGEYPVIELIVKMGHISLIENIMDKLITSSRKEDIKENVEELEQLFNKDTTKGTMVLRIPSYISNYLKERHASLSDYFFWRDVFEIENISKENFEKFLNLPERILLSSNVFDGEERTWYSSNWYSLGIQNIIKYDGYTLEKTIKYCFHKRNDIGGICGDKFYSIFNFLGDTLCMAEELDFELEPYPENLKQIHDQLAAIQREKKDEIANEKVQDIAKECSDVMDNVFSSNSADLPTKAMEKLTYVFPESQKDFTQEGQNQNNCVAGYFSRVKSGECIIFFVRKKEDANSSYITAEIKKDGINQVMYSNNRIVPRESMDFKYCKYIANKILKAIDTDKIHAIHKILKD